MINIESYYRILWCVIFLACYQSFLVLKKREYRA